MKIISFTTNQELFLGAPVFFLNCYEEVNSQEELKRSINFTKTLPPNEIIRRGNNKYKEVKDIFETETMNKMKEIESKLLKENIKNTIYILEQKFDI